MISCVLALSGKLVFVYRYLPHKIISEMAFAFQISLLAIVDIIDIMDIIGIMDIIDIMDIIGIMDIIDIMDIMGIMDIMDIMAIIGIMSIMSFWETKSVFLLGNRLLFPEIDLESKLF